MQKNANAEGQKLQKEENQSYSAKKIENKFKYFLFFFTFFRSFISK